MSRRSAAVRDLSDAPTLGDIAGLRAAVEGMEHRLSGLLRELVDVERETLLEMRAARREKASDALTSEEAQARMKCSDETLRRRAKAGLIRVYRDGARLVRYSARSIDEFMRQRAHG